MSTNHNTDMTDFPEPMVKAIKALGNKNMRKILLYLLDRGPGTALQIQEETKIDYETLEKYLKIMSYASLIRPFYDSPAYIGTATINHQYYEPTPLAKVLVNNIIKSYMGIEAKEAPVS